MSILEELADDYQRADALVNLLINRATGTESSEDEFALLRSYFVNSPDLVKLLPPWFPSKRSLDQFWNFIKNRFSTYAERREYLWSEFNPLMTRLESQQARRILDETSEKPLPPFEDGRLLTAAQLNALVQRVNTFTSPPQNFTAVTQIVASPLFHKRAVRRDDSLVFVLMPFTERWSDYVWRSEIKPLVEGIPECSLRCIRADDLYGHDVVQDIYESIVRARIVIADITGRNANVFYELGIAHTIGKDVILLSQGTEHIPFDLQRFRHCIYANDGPGYQVLRDYIPKAILSVLRGIEAK